MADQIFAVSSGFYDAVEGDRTYSAEDMNRPYRRLVSNGVFATPQGTASTDLQVIPAGNMNVIVRPGEGIFGDKWLENPAAMVITVPSNTSTVPRLDSVLVQVDKRTSGRVGNIVYRTGTPSSSPSAPAINEIANVIEYRLANVRVSAGANTIAGSAITDLRGSESCPWITSLIEQVDTSVLFRQWQTAYEMYYDESTQDFDTYVAQQRVAWEAFLESLTDDLTVSTSVITFSNTYETAGTTSSVPIGIASYDKYTDVLQVYINGLLAVVDEEYTVSNDATSITLTDSLTAGQKVTFVVFKSLISADIQSAVSLIQALDTKLSTHLRDSGWLNRTLQNGATAYDSNSVPAVRRIGDRVYLRGAVKGVTAVPTTIFTIPLAYSPAMAHHFSSNAVSNGSVVPLEMEVDTSGNVTMIAKGGTINAVAMVPVATDFALG